MEVTGQGSRSYRRSSHTYVCGFRLGQLQFLLGVLEGLGVLVELILGGLQLLLQCQQVILQLVDTRSKQTDR